MNKISFLFCFLLTLTTRSQEVASIIKLGTFQIYYDATLKKMIDFKNPSFLDHQINQNNFPTQSKGQESYEVYLINFIEDEKLSLKKILKKIVDLGYEAGTLEVLFQFEPKIKNDTLIILALGSFKREGSKKIKYLIPALLTNYNLMSNFNLSTWGNGYDLRNFELHKGSYLCLKKNEIEKLNTSISEVPIRKDALIALVFSPLIQENKKQKPKILFTLNKNNFRFKKKLNEKFSLIGGKCPKFDK